MSMVVESGKRKWEERVWEQNRASGEVSRKRVEWEMGCRKEERNETRENTSQIILQAK